MSFENIRTFGTNLAMETISVKIMCTFNFEKKN